MFPRIRLTIVALLSIAFLVAPGRGESGNVASATTYQKGPSRSEGTANDVPGLDKDERAARLAIMPVREDMETPNPHFSLSKGERKLIRISVTNVSAEPIWLLINDFRVQHRPRLVKDGKLVPYPDRVNKIAAYKDKYGPSGTRVFGKTIQPNQTVGLDSMDLDDWYEPLQPGHYELTLKYRFRHRGPQVETNTTSFDVVP